MVTAAKLELDDNTTCELYRSGLTNIHFYTVNITSLALNTPLQTFFQEARYRASPNSVVHLSDALRVLLVWRYGGLYLDTDYVVLNDMSHYKNITVKIGAGEAVTNNAFAFSAGHPLLELVMLHMAESYRPGCWTCIGPELLTKSLRQYQSSQSQASDVSLVPMARSHYHLLSLSLSNLNIAGSSQ